MHKELLNLLQAGRDLIEEALTAQRYQSSGIMSPPPVCYTAHIAAVDRLLARAQEPKELLIVIEGGMLDGVYSDDESLIGCSYTKIDYDTDDVEDGDLTTVRQSGGDDSLAIVETFEIERSAVRVIRKEDYERAAKAAGYHRNAAGMWEHQAIGEDGMSDVRELCDLNGITV